MKPSMTIAFSVNHRFLMLCLSAIASILYNAEGEDTFHFIILHSELSEDDLNYFKKLKKLRPFDLSIRKIDYNRFASFPLVWTTQETWYRCLLADLFPQESRILYLDSDVIVRKSLSPLWEIDLGTDLVAGVEDIVLSRYNSKLLGLKQNYYINAGVLLINAYQWRKERLLQAIELYVKNNKVYQADQGTINVIADGRKFRLSPQFDYIETDLTFCQYDTRSISIYKQKDPVIVHFTGIKPNHPQCTNSFREEFATYYNMVTALCFSDENPSKKLTESFYTVPYTMHSKPAIDSCKAISFLGIPIYESLSSYTEKRIKILGLSIYSRKTKGYNIKTRYLFFTHRRMDVQGFLEEKISALTEEISELRNQKTT